MTLRLASATGIYRPRKNAIAVDSMCIVSLDNLVLGERGDQTQLAPSILDMRRHGPFRRFRVGGGDRLYNHAMALQGVGLHHLKVQKCQGREHGGSSVLDCRL